MRTTRGEGVAASAASPPGGEARKRTRLFIAALLLPVAALLLPSTLVLAVCLLPALAARVADRTPNGALTVTVTLPNLCGSLPAMIELWSRGHAIGQASSVLGDPFLWLVAYGGASLGWAIYLLLPPLLRGYYALTTDARIKALERQQEILRETWGPEVGGRISPPEPPTSEGQRDSGA